MLSEIKLPVNPEFLADLVIQRTGSFLRLGGGAALHNWFNYGDKQGIVNFLNNNNLTKSYIQELVSEISTEVKELKAFLNKECLNKIVSIGPGNGIIELLLLTEELTSEIVLIDVEDTDNRNHGFASKGAGYANLESTKSFILSNVNANVRICNPQKEEVPKFEFTLFLSLLSMGFHYPCDEYISFIKNNAAKNAIIIFDSRRGVNNGVEKLLESFVVENVIEGEKSDRLFLKNTRS